MNVRQALVRFALGFAENQLRRSGAVSIPGYPLARLGFPWMLPAETINFPFAYRLIPDIYFAVSLIQDTIAGLPLKFYTGTGDSLTEIERRPGNVVDLWELGNHQDTGYDLKEQLVGAMLVSGNAYLFKEYLGQAKPQELWVLPGHTVNPIPGPNRTVIRYDVWTNGMEPIGVPPFQIVHFRRYDPDHGVLGLSPLLTSQLAYETQRDSARFQREFFRRGGTVAGHYSTDVAVDEETIKRLKEEMKRRFGGPENAWDPVILPKSLKYVRSGLTHQEMNFLESSKLTTQDILRVFKIPPTVAGIHERRGIAPTDTNSDQLLYYQQCIMPLCARIEAILNERLLGGVMGMAEFGPDVSCRFDYSSVLVFQDVWLAQAKAYAIATGGPVMTRAEARARLKLEVLDNPDLEELLIPMGATVDLGTAAQDKAGADAQAQASVDAAEETSNADEPGGRLRAGYYVTKGKKLAPAVRQRARRRADRLLRMYERKVERAYAKMLNGQRTRVVAEAEKTYADRKNGAVKNRLLNLDDLLEQDASDRELILAVMREMVEDVGSAAMADLGLELTFNLQRQDVIAWIESKVDRGLRYVDGTTRDELRDAIAEGVMNGEGLSGIVARINEVFDRRVENAATIARTETAGGYNYATVEAWRQTDGVVEAKEWLTAHDDAVREWHAEADGQQVLLDEPFVVDDEELEYPGDPAGSASNVINCRCTMLPVVADMSDLGSQQEKRLLPAARLEEVFG